jgi:hypothetical protein
MAPARIDENCDGHHTRGRKFFIGSLLQMRIQYEPEAMLTYLAYWARFVVVGEGAAS